MLIPPPLHQLLLFLFLYLHMTAADCVEKRAVQSAAVCLPEFSWMDNSLRQSPCNVAGYLLTACGNGRTWDVCVITNSSHYTPPTKENANGCRCSWAVYNTLQACADCQGQDYANAMLTWAGYNVNCTDSLLSDTYYPEDVPIPDETAIPFWATMNPSEWPGGEFDPVIAQNLTKEGDITQLNRTSSSAGQRQKRSNTGAIAGGVVGGVIGVLLLALVAIYTRRKGFAFIPGHRRSDSANSRVPFQYARFSPLSHAHTESAGSMPYGFADGSGRTMMAQATNWNPSNPGMIEPMSASSAFATGASSPSDVVPLSTPMRVDYTRQLSSEDGVDLMDKLGSGESLEGRIEPYVLPLLRAGSQTAMGAGVRTTSNSSSGGTGAKGAHGRTQSDSSTGSHPHEVRSAPRRNEGEGVDAGATGHMTVLPPPSSVHGERDNPPAYELLSPDYSPDTGSADVERNDTGRRGAEEPRSPSDGSDVRSTEAQRAETTVTLSGTTVHDTSRSQTQRLSVWHVGDRKL